jgi:hypothetical protein
MMQQWVIEPNIIYCIFAHQTAESCKEITKLYVFFAVDTLLANFINNSFFSAQIFQNTKMDSTSTDPTGSDLVWIVTSSFGTNLAGKKSGG